MSRIFALSICLCVLILGACRSGAPPAAAEPPSSATPAAAVPAIEPALRRLASYDGASDSTAEMRLTVESGDGKRDQLDFRLQRKYMPDSVKTFLTVLAPREESDKALLAVERADRATEAFSYLAGLKRVAKLASSSTLTFRGTKVTVQELLGLELAHYVASASERIREGDEEFLKYTLDAPAERTLAFKRIIGLFRNAEDPVPVRFELYDDRERLQKTMRIEEMRAIEGRRTITRIAVEDHAQNRRLRLDTRTMQFNRRLADKLFTEANLIDWTSGASRRLLDSP